MKSPLVTALLLVAGTAHAGGYIGLGIGDGVGASGDVRFDASGRTGRILGGFRFGRIAAEASAGRAPVIQQGGRPYDITQLSVAAKYSFPLSDGFEVFGRLGLHRTSLTSNVSADVDSKGSGILFGGGAEFRSKLPVSFWIDYTVANCSLNGPSDRDTGLTTRQWMIGASLGI